MAGRELAGDIEQRDQLPSVGPPTVRRLQLPSGGRQRAGTQSTQPRVLLHGDTTRR